MVASTIDHRDLNPGENSRYLLTTKITPSDVAGFVEVIETEATLVAAACNHPNLLVIPFRAELIRCAA